MENEGQIHIIERSILVFTNIYRSMSNNNEKFKELYEKATDMFFGLTKKFDGLSEKLFETTGIKINIGLIVGSAILILVVGLFVKIILGGVMDFLFGR